LGVVSPRARALAAAPLGARAQTAAPAGGGGGQGDGAQAKAKAAQAKAKAGQLPATGGAGFWAIVGLLLAGTGLLGVIARKALRDSRRP
jgi:hypothetical protein